MINNPTTVLLLVVVTTLYGVAFYKWQGGGTLRLLLYLLASWLGFLLSPWIGELLQPQLTRFLLFLANSPLGDGFRPVIIEILQLELILFNDLHIITTTLGSLLVLTIIHTTTVFLPILGEEIPQPTELIIITWLLFLSSFIPAVPATRYVAFIALACAYWLSIHKNGVARQQGIIAIVITISFIIIRLF